MATQSNDSREPFYQSLFVELRSFIETAEESTAGKILLIGIGAASGTGKTTLAYHLQNYLQLQGKKTLVLEMDSFFKSPEERQQLGEWHPDHVRLKEARGVLQAIKEGKKRIVYLGYLRKPVKKMQPMVLDLRRMEIIIFEGLYAINNNPRLGQWLDFIDIAIYLEANLKDVKRWRFEQEIAKVGGRNTTEMAIHWENGILPDTLEHVQPTANNADIIIHVDAYHRFSIQSLGKPQP